MRVDCLSHVDVVAGHLGLVAALAQGPAGGPSSTSWPVRVRLSTTAASTNSKAYPPPGDSSLSPPEATGVRGQTAKAESSHRDTDCPLRAGLASRIVSAERRGARSAAVSGGHRNGLVECL